MKRLTIILLLAIIAPVLSGTVFAGAAEIKAQMKARLPQIAVLKNAQSIGENNRGSLEAMPGKKLTASDTALIAAENTDRQTIYGAIAKKTGTSAADVGKRRAIAIAKSAQPGTKIQAADGSWKTK